MKIPEVFFGTLKKVKANCRKVNTQLKNGSNLEECLSKFREVNSEDYPQSLFWVDKAWSMAGASQHFILCEFSYSLDCDQRFDHTKLNRIYNESIDWLSSTPWGTLMLNSTQNYSWVLKLPWGSGPRIRGEYAVLKSFRDHYKELSGLGSRFYGGGLGGTELEGVILQVLRVLTGMKKEYSEHLKQLIDPLNKQKYYLDVHKLIVENQVVEKFYDIMEI